ncbi:hypothetical protein [Clostridium botulinum]|uniref:hypothetical protein n=1 Tax=Clostridium botulinum TaxID=1491 RepID=UPI00196887DD|nr:hypothetical protein [Clostridium botulinum]MBN1058503.1 hypothetical protein [Clostridium botulinum]
MKAFKIYVQDRMGYEEDEEYALKYDKAIRLFNDKVRKAVKEVKGDLVDQEDFSEQVHYLREDYPGDNEVDIISRKMPYIAYKKNDKLYAVIPFWEKTSYEYDEWDISDMTVVLEEIEILE